ncbi:MAG TPA: beta-ketoacyl-[acyl-carrier-protein] synthase family protein [Candidatus Binatia bacterium]|jgi:3-oxoacyl-[acyl-carrier-protein] synthase II|nr:beta-ketoacyl-[acyl-carrier-protein] synthase family protein [Candidatus Binatia bacterium]
MTDVVVTGVGAVHPFGRGVDALWAGVLGAGTGVRPVERFDTRGLPTRFAAQVPEDVRAALPDPDAEWSFRYALAALDDALADAGLDAAAVAGAPCEVHFGFESPFYDFAAIGHRLAAALAGGRVDARRLAATGGDDLAWGLPERFLRGVEARCGRVETVSMVAAACASATEAIGAGLRAVRSGRVPVALVGAGDCKVNPIAFGATAILQMTSRRNDSPETASRPFDRTRDGMVIGEGGAALVLESAAHARARGARVLARLAGFASTADARHLTDPDEEGRTAARAIREALADAGLETVDYVNAHGTSTAMNDRAEVAALKRAFAGRAMPAMSSTKGATGHLMAASGALEAVVCVRALAEQTVPPTLHFREPDPRCDIDVTPNVPRRARLEAICSSSFGFGGQNACLVLTHPRSNLGRRADHEREEARI